MVALSAAAVARTNDYALLADLPSGVTRHGYLSDSKLFKRDEPWLTLFQIDSRGMYNLRSIGIEFIRIQ